MSRPKAAVPSYRLHKASGQAVVYLDRREHYLGPYDSPESRQRYAALLYGREAAATKVDPVPKPATFLVAELLLRFATERLPKYLTPDGAPSAEQACYQSVLKIVRELFGQTPA
ncbi:MAG: hypothetical protein SFV23_25945, partial [Planctomycetaceae bacterium]|nr:hypothetical protein [Planctomycetaceae bacterium]